MRHVVINEKVKCKKCLKEHMGASVHLWDEFYSCTDCYYNGYEKELKPKIKSMCEEYFQPERSKREDSYFVEFGCSVPIAFNTSEGRKVMQPGKSYDQNLNEI